MRSHRLLLLTLLLSTPSLFSAVYAQPQIVPDGTLNGENSRVQPSDSGTDIIDRGASRGRFLFHSFEQFSVGEGRRAYFANPDGIDHILSRVTGNSRSDIFGTLGVLGDANLFFLNPNGIVFGPNARLDISGSFVASTGDRFTFPDGSVFSAMDPNAPPLLTVNVKPGLQLGAGQAPLVNEGRLSPGQDLSLHGDRLTLQGELTAGGNLTLQGDRIQIRDTTLTPFIADAGGALTLEGNDIDIFALNHPLSELVSGGDMVLRSRSPVVGDAHYRSGGDFRIETVDGGLNALTSPNDPVIRAAGDVAFDSYTGASLHIFAGGSVTVPGEIEITGADPANGLVETVELADGSIVQINGQTTPTLDVRAGILAVTPEGTSGGAPPVTTSGDANGSAISIGSIRNPGGTVFLTNQYQPNPALAAGDITVGAIDTSLADQVLAVTNGISALRVEGGDVVVDSRGGISLTGEVDTSAAAEIGSFFTFVPGDGEAVAIGGDVRLRAAGAVTTQRLDSSAAADVSVEDGQSGDGLASDAIAIATGGDITVEAQSFTATEPLTTASRASAVVDAIANADINPSAAILDVRGGEVGTVQVAVTSGNLTVTTQGAIAIDEVDTSANTFVQAFAFADASDFQNSNADTLNLTGGRVEAVTVDVAGGNIALESQASISTGNLSTGADGFNDVDGSAIAIERGDVNGITLRGGEIGTVTVELAGGDIALDAQSSIQTGGVTTTANLNAETFAIASADTFGEANTLDAIGGNIDSVTFTAAAGDVALEAGDTITTDDIVAVSIAGDFFELIVDADAETNLLEDADADTLRGQGGTIGSSAIALTGGNITLEAQSDINTGVVRAGGFGDVVTEARASAETDNDEIIEQVDLLGGAVQQVNMTVAGGAVTVSSPGAIATEDPVTTQVEAELTADAGANLRTSAEVETTDLVGGTAEQVAVTVTGGEFALETASSITTENIRTAADAAVRVNAAASDSRDANSEGGQLGTVAVTVTGETLNLTADAGLMTGNLDSSAEAFVALDGTVVPSGDPLAGTATGGDITLTSRSGAIAPLPETGIRSNVIRGNGDGGTIRLDADSIQLTDNFLVTTISGNGSAGTITLLAADDVTLTNSRLFTVREASSAGNGTAGNVEITGRSITLDDFSFLNTATFGTGDAGRVALETTNGDIVLTDSSIFSLTAIEGDAAPISLQSAGAVRLNGNSAINSTVGLGAVGEGADIRIDAAEGVFVVGVGERPEGLDLGTDPELPEVEPNDSQDTPQSIDDGFALANNANVLFSNDVPFVSVTGANGNFPSDFYSFTVEAVGTQVTFDIDGVTPTDPGQTLDTDLTLYDDQGNQLAFNDDAPIHLGAGGSTSPNDAYLTYVFNRPGTYVVELDLDPERFDIDESGTYTLNISRVEDGLVNSGITTQTLSAGRSGNITVNAPLIDLQSGGQISAETLRNGRAGDITLQPFADGVSMAIALENGTQITGSTLDVGNGGNLTLRAPETIRITGEGRMAVETLGSGNAGTLSVDTARLTIRDGVTLSALTSAEATGNAGNLVLEASDRLLIQDANVTVSSEGAGDAGTLVVRGERLRLQDNGQILAFTTGSGTGGSILVETEVVSLSGNSLLSVESRGAGPAGNITLNTGRLRVAEAAQISATATEASTATERGGSVTLNASRMNLAGTVGIFSETGSSAPAGILRLGPSIGDGTLRLQLADGAEISASTRSSGNGGDLVLQAEEAIAIRGDGRLAAATESSGPAGDVRVETPRFSLSGNVSLSAETTGSGPGGNLAIAADDISITDGAEVTVSSLGAIAGNLDIVANRLTLEDGSISASTENGAAGQLRLLVTDEIALTNSRLSVEASRGGRAGDLQLQTDTLTVDDSAITVSSPEGQAGNVGITANFITLDNGEISAETGRNSGSGDASANVILDGLNLLFMQNGSVIAAQANAGANGGNIRIDASDGFIVANEGSNNDIIASARLDGEGGRIDIAAVRLFGLEERPGLFNDLRQNTTNDISASSEFGISGTIIIDELGIDPVQGTTELPTDTAPPPLAQGCQGTASSSRFIDTRRGGLPPQAADLASGDRLWESVGFSQNQGGGEEAQNIETLDLEETAPAIIEMQNWQYNDNGQIVLVAESSDGIETCQWIPR